MFPCDVKAVIYFVPVSAVRKFGTPQLAFHVEKTSADNFRVFFPGRPTRYCVVHKNHTFTISEQIKECVSIIRIWFFKGGGSCQHFWERRTYLRRNNKRISVNEARRIIRENQDTPLQTNNPNVAKRPRDMENRGFINPNIAQAIKTPRN